MRVLVADWHHDNIAHASFNAAMLSVVRHAFPRAEITFWGSEAQVCELSKSVTAVQWKTYPVRRLPAVPRARLPYDWSTIGLVKNACPDLFLDLCAFPTSAVLARLRLPREVAVQVVWHSILNQVRRVAHPFDVIQKLFGMRAAVIDGDAKGIQSIILEEDILSTLCRLIDRTSAGLVAIPHPVFMPKARSGGTPYRIGFIGTCTAEKGFDRFVETAVLSAKMGLPFEFHAVGMDYDGRVYPCLATQPTTTPISAEEYANRVMELGLVFLALDEGHYSLAASGSLIDCMAFGKPLATVGTGPVQRLLRANPLLGVAAADSANLLEELQRVDAVKSAQMRASMVSCAESRTPEALSNRYRDATLRRFPRLRALAD